MSSEKKSLFDSARTGAAAAAPQSHDHALVRVIETMSLEMNFEKLCRYATQVTMEVLGADFSALALPRPDQRLRFQHFWGFPPEVDTSALPSITPGTLAAFKTGAPVFVADYANYGGALREFLDAGVRAGFAAPIRLGDAVTGVLTLAWRRQVAAPSDSQIALVEAVLRQVGFAQQREHLMTELSGSRTEAIALHDRLRRVLSVSPVVIYNMTYDPNPSGNRLRTSYLSENFEALLGYPTEWFTANPDRWYELIHPEDLPGAALKNHPEAIARGGLEREYRLRHRDGRYVWVRDRLRVFRIEGQDTLDVVGAVMDITERKDLDIAAQAIEARYRSLVEQSMVAVYLVQDGRFQYVNPKLAEIFGCTQEEVLAAPSMLDFIPEEDHPIILENFRRRLSGEIKSVQYEFRVKRKDGKLVDVEAHGAVTTLHGKPAILGMGIEIGARKAAEAELRRHRDHLEELVAEQTIGLIAAKDAAENAMREAKRAEEQTRYLAFNDGLTGVPNRVLLLERMQQAISQSKRTDRKFALFFVDLDRFKNINDSLGHFVGDKLLCEVARRLTRCVRQTDTVSRPGGDEFVILLADVEDRRAAADVAEKLLAAVARPYFIDGHPLNVTHSIGISIFPDDGHDVEVLMRKADAAMYRAKEAGRNNYQFVTGDMTEQALSRLSLENDLRLAIERGEFELHYQPLVSLRAGSIVGVEALLRWRHPERGLLLPEQFISLAEESGLIVPIGKWALRTACRQHRAWHDAGASSVRVSVNLSAVQLRRRDFLQDMIAILGETEMDASRLNIELTESVLMHGADAAQSAIRSLKEMGVRLSLDDFGTDYSSLSYLKRFPVDVLKIDRAFTSDITTDPDDAAITRAIVSLGHSLRLVVVAEGVETRAQVEFLRGLKCDEAQGNYFARPLTPGELESLLRENAFPELLPERARRTARGPGASRRQGSARG